MESRGAVACAPRTLPSRPTDDPQQPVRPYHPDRRVEDSRSACDRGDWEPRLAPKWLTWGVGLPGYLTGWFRLNNGETALVFLGPANRAVYIPTRDGPVILITPDDPDALLLSLQRARETR